MVNQHSGKQARVFYGYWIMAATFFFAFIYSGCGFYAFSLFVLPLQRDLGWTRSEIMATLTIFFLVSGAIAPVVGRLVDRYGARGVMATGAFVAGIGFALLTLMSNLWHFYASYVIIGMGISAAGIIPSTAVISNWYKKRRGTALGIMSAGIGAGGLVLSPLIGGYLIPNHGWRITFLVLAFFVWALIPLALFVIRTRPSDMGLYPDGEKGSKVASETKTSLPASDGLNVRRAMTTPAFWLIAVSFLAFGISEVGILQNEVPYLEGIGFTAAMAASVHGVVGLWSAVGKLGFGWLCDHIKAEHAFAIGTALQIVGTIILINIEVTSPAAIIWLYAFMMGFGVGNWLPTMSMVISTNFGLVAYGAIFGMISVTQNIGAATGPLLAGYIYDTMGTYNWAFIILGASYAVSMLSMLAVRRPRSS